MRAINNILLSSNNSPIQTFWNKCGFILCTGGCAVVSLNEHDYRLTRGSVLIITPLVIIDNMRQSNDYAEISFVDDLKVFYPIFQQISDTSIPLRVSEAPCWQLSEEEIAYVARQDMLIRAKRKVVAMAKSVDEQNLQRYIIQLLLHETMLEVVSNHFCHKDMLGNTNNRQVAIAYRFLLLLHENYHHERHVSWYALEAKLSAGHFTAIVRSATGKTPSQWIAAVTIIYAKFLLERNEKSIKEIAQDLNFPEQFTFRKYFKQHTGFSPKAYRMQHLSAC